MTRAPSWARWMGVASLALGAGSIGVYSPYFFGACSIVTCAVWALPGAVLAILAMSLGRRASGVIQRSGGEPVGFGAARVGLILGVVGIIISIVYALGIVMISVVLKAMLSGFGLLMPGLAP